MAQQDYIIRMIEQLAAFLWSIIFNKEVGIYEYALEEIESAYNGLLGLDSSKIKNLEIDEIIKNNTCENGLNIGNIEAIASLLFEEADILERMQGINRQSGAYYQKAFSLFCIAYQESNIKRYLEKSTEVLVKLESYEKSKE